MLDDSQKKKNLFTDEEIRAVNDLGQVLRRIHRRLYSEGYILRNGVFVKSDVERNSEN